MFSNQTSQFPTRSLYGNKYIMVIVEINNNAIPVEPMNSHKNAKNDTGIKCAPGPTEMGRHCYKKHVLNNEVSANMKNYICNMCKFNMELVPLGCHQCNAAKVAILNFKAHFLSALVGVAGDFPPNLWDWLAQHTKIMINLIWLSYATPNVLAYVHLSGPFDYNKMPLAPMGCEAQVHEKTDKHGTWAYHSASGWYLFTLPEHYCTHNCHMKHTKSK
jgi:hypothetical protein